MAPTAANVQVATTGGAYHAPDGTTIPTDADSNLEAAFLANEVGYISEDGITQTIDEDAQQIRAWQNGDTVRTVQTSHDLTYAFTMIETNDAVLAAYYGADNVADGVVEVKAGQTDRGPWVFEVLDGDTHLRIVVPDGQVTERGDVEFVNGNAISYPVTITCYPDATGVKAYQYIDGAEGVDGGS